MSDAGDSSLGLCTIRNNDVGSVNPCSGEVEYAQYGYNVTQGRTIAILVIFSLITLAHFVQALFSRRWFLFPTIFLCALGEVIGWAARLISSTSTAWRPIYGGYWYSSREAFMAQIATLIIAPVFLTAGWYILLGHLIRFLGPQYGRLYHRTYALIFVTADVACLVVQAIGGGAAASADNSEDAEKGANVMVAGVFLQMAVMVAFVFIFIDFAIAFSRKRPVRQVRFAFWKPRPTVDAVSPGDLSPDAERRAKLLLWATAASVLMVFVRSIYRCIELLDGWTGPIIQNETLFCVLDALPIALALFIFNIIHPMWYLRKPRAPRGGSVLQEKKGERSPGSMTPPSV